MLSKKALEGFIFNIKFGNFMGALPFTYDMKNNKIVPLPIRKRYKAFLFCVLFYLLNVYFTLLLIYYTFKDSRSPEWNFCFLIVSSGQVGTIFISAFQIYADDICNTISVLLKFMMQFHKEFFEPNVKGASYQRIEFHIKWGNRVSVLYPIGLFCAYFQLYDMPPLPYGALPLSYRHISIAISFGPVLIWITWNIWAMIIFWVNVTIIFAHAFENIGQEIRTGRASYRTSEAARSSDVVMKTITCMRLLFFRHKQIVRNSLLPLQTVVTRSILCTIYIIIKYFDTKYSMYLHSDVNYVLIASGVWCMHLKMLEGISKSLNKCSSGLNNFPSKSVYQRKYVKMYMKSCRFAAYRIGDVSVVSRKSVLKYIKSISKGTVKLLMNTR